MILLLRSIIAQRIHFHREIIIVCCHGTGISKGAEVLPGIETCPIYIAPATAQSSPERCTLRLCVILHHSKAIIATLMAAPQNQ